MVVVFVRASTEASWISGAAARVVFDPLTSAVVRVVVVELEVVVVFVRASMDAPWRLLPVMFVSASTEAPSETAAAVCVASGPLVSAAVRVVVGELLVELVLALASFELAFEAVRVIVTVDVVMVPFLGVAVSVTVNVLVVVSVSVTVKDVVVLLSRPWLSWLMGSAGSAATAFARVAAAAPEPLESAEVPPMSSTVKL